MARKQGLFIGKFYPLHAGHEFVIRRALQVCDAVTVIVFSRDDETIPGETRRYWIEKQFPWYCNPGLEVVHLIDNTPDPDNNEYLWEHWVRACLIGFNQNKIRVSKPDYVFGSDSYIYELAKRLEAEPWIVDLDRDIFPISASHVRELGAEHCKEFLSSIVYSYMIEHEKNSTSRS